MTFAGWFGVALSVELFVIGVVYACYRDWNHAGYYVSASVLNTFVVLMK